MALALRIQVCTVPVVIGIVVGDLIFLLLAIYGLSAIAETFSMLFLLV